MSRYKAYPAYKDSAVNWLNSIPTHWGLNRFKNIFKIQKKIAGALGYDVLSITQRGVKIKDTESGDGQLSMDYSKYQLVRKNDFAMNHMDLLTGYVDISKFDGVTSPDYRVFSLADENQHPRYFLYLLQLCYIAKIFYPLGQGAAQIGRWRLPTEAFSEFVAPTPAYAEQQSIAAFLDHETMKIDALIEKQQRLIELLKEKRQAVISHAVTQGLNPNAPMKDSGVEWLGEVPAHWSLPKVKWFFCTESGGTPNTAKHDDYYLDGTIPWIRTTDLNNDELYETPINITKKAVVDSACALLPVNSVLVAMYGGAGSIGKHALLKFESAINQAVCAILPNPKIGPEFLHLYVEFYRPYWMVGAEGTRKDPNINQDVIRELIVPCPPYDEQRKIVETIKVGLSKIDSTIKRCETNIALIQERRTALISAAVTGKIDVRDWQAVAVQEGVGVES